LWWRKVQELGLSWEYKAKNADGCKTELASFLHELFSLPYLEPELVKDFFFTNVIIIAPSTPPQVLYLLEYLNEWYMKEDACFPPSFWAEMSASMTHTTNACEAFHPSFNSNFYSSHPNIFVFLKILKTVQVDTQILLN